MNNDSSNTLGNLWMEVDNGEWVKVAPILSGMNLYQLSPAFLHETYVRLRKLSKKNKSRRLFA